MHLRAELLEARSGMNQHHGDQRRERHKCDDEEEDKVPPVARWLNRLKHLVAQLRQVSGQGGEVVEGYRGERRGAALIELVQAKPAHGSVPLQGPQDGVAVVV
jgi:hypothetical protein